MISDRICLLWKRGHEKDHCSLGQDMSCGEQPCRLITEFVPVKGDLKEINLEVRIVRA